MYADNVTRRRNSAERYRRVTRRPGIVPRKRLRYAYNAFAFLIDPASACRSRAKPCGRTAVTFTYATCQAPAAFSRLTCRWRPTPPAFRNPSSAPALPGAQGPAMVIMSDTASSRYCAPRARSMEPRTEASGYASRRAASSWQNAMVSSSAAPPRARRPASHSSRKQPTHTSSNSRRRSTWRPAGLPRTLPTRDEITRRLLLLYDA